MKINKLFLFLILGFVLLSSLVYAFFVLAVVNVVPPGNCNGPYPPGTNGLDYGYAGYIGGTFNYTGAPMNSTNGTLLHQTFFDTCAANNTLIEFVCGGQINPAYNAYAGAVLVTCGEPGVPGTQCVMVPYSPGGPLAGRCQ